MCDDTKQRRRGKNTPLSLRRTTIGPLARPTRVATPASPVVSHAVNAIIIIIVVSSSHAMTDRQPTAATQSKKQAMP